MTTIGFSIRYYSTEKYNGVVFTAGSINIPVFFSTPGCGTVVLLREVPMSDVVLTDQNFDTDVLKAEKPVLVDFWAVWCVPCRVQGPIVEEIANDFDGKAIVGKMNVDEQPNVPQQFGIMSIPTLMIFHKGKMVKQFIGTQSKETLENELKKLVN